MAVITVVTCTWGRAKLRVWGGYIKVDMPHRLLFPSGWSRDGKTGSLYCVPCSAVQHGAALGYAPARGTAFPPHIEGPSGSTEDVRALFASAHFSFLFS